MKENKTTKAQAIKELENLLAETGTRCQIYGSDRRGKLKDLRTEEIQELAAAIKAGEHECKTIFRKYRPENDPLGVWEVAIS